MELFRLIVDRLIKKLFVHNSVVLFVLSNHLVILRQPSDTHLIES